MRHAKARGIVAEPATKARRAEVADGADSPTRATKGGEAARPNNFTKISSKIKLKNK
jgi:hypothetical protein